MKLFISISVAFLLFIACNIEKDELFYKIVNSNFINFTDTVAYKSKSFVLIPNNTYDEKSQYLTNTELLVLVDTVFADSKELAKSLLRELAKKKSEEFKGLIENNLESQESIIDIKKINSTGKYRLVASGTVEKIDKSYIGHITFSKPYITNDKAIIFFSVKSSPKAGRTNAFLLKRTNEDWNIIENIELERW